MRQNYKSIYFVQSNDENPIISYETLVKIQSVVLLTGLIQTNYFIGSISENTEYCIINWVNRNKETSSLYSSVSTHTHTKILSNQICK